MAEPVKRRIHFNGLVAKLLAFFVVLFLPLAAHSDSGAQVTLASQGREGVDCLLRSLVDGPLFDLVLMDCQMPIMDGFDLAEKIRARPGVTGLTILMLTSGGQPGDAARLDGQVHLVPEAESKSVNGKLTTTVPTVPDAPISANTNARAT